MSAHTPTAAGSGGSSSAVDSPSRRTRRPSSTRRVLSWDDFEDDDGSDEDERSRREDEEYRDVTRARDGGGSNSSLKRKRGRPKGSKSRSSIAVAAAAEATAAANSTAAAPATHGTPDSSTADSHVEAGIASPTISTAVAPAPRVRTDPAPELARLLASIGTDATATQLARIHVLQRKVVRYNKYAAKLQLQRDRQCAREEKRQSRQNQSNHTTPTSHPSLASWTNEDTEEETSPPKKKMKKGIPVTVKPHSASVLTAIPVRPSPAMALLPTAHAPFAHLATPALVEASTDERPKRKLARKVSLPPPPVSHRLPAPKPDVIEHIQVDLPPLYDESEAHSSASDDAYDDRLLSGVTSPDPTSDRVTEFDRLHSLLQVLAQSSRMHHHVLGIEDTRVVQYTARVIAEAVPTDRGETSDAQLADEHDGASAPPPIQALPALLPAATSLPSLAAHAAPTRPRHADHLPMNLHLSSFTILSALIDSAAQVFQTDVVEEILRMQLRADNEDDAELQEEGHQTTALQRLATPAVTIQ